MNKLIRMTSLAAALTLTATPAFAVNPDQQARANARIIKPLVLTWVKDLDLGTIVLSGPGTWTGAVISVDQNGNFSCTDTNVAWLGYANRRLHAEIARQLLAQEVERLSDPGVERVPFAAQVVGRPGLDHAGLGVAHRAADLWEVAVPVQLADFRPPVGVAEPCVGDLGQGVAAFDDVAVAVGADVDGGGALLGQHRRRVGRMTPSRPPHPGYRLTPSPAISIIRAGFTSYRMAMYW